MHFALKKRAKHCSLKAQINLTANRVVYEWYVHLSVRGEKRKRRVIGVITNGISLFCFTFSKKVPKQKFKFK